MNHPILIIEDDKMQRHMLTTLLHRELGFSAHEAENGRVALDILKTDALHSIKLIILDLNMPVMNGMETLGILNQTYPSIPVIMLTGSDDIQDAIKTIKLGAIDFITKPYQSDRILITIKNALKISALSKEVSRLKSKKNGTSTFENLVGYDSGLASVVNTGRRAATVNIPVLLTGETGTGKEVFVRAIHGEGPRAGKPFITVNCGAIPSQLVESILFGHEKGAFTGATEKAIGKFREAEGGTLFLDEIGELPLDTQVKLLRVLQQKEVEPVGSSKTFPVNVRVISATNRDLEKEVKAGKFREDLFFRLNVLEIKIPPLRDRKEDIPALIKHFIERFCANENIIPKALSAAAQEKLMCNNWPGNVRQLENNINRAMTLNENSVLDIDDFQTNHTDDRNTNTTSPRTINEKHNIIHMTSHDGSLKTARAIEQEVINIALSHFDNNITKAAKALNIARSTFYKKIKSREIHHD